MEEPLIRVGLVGCGNVALNAHVPAYLRQPDRFRVVAVADPTPARLELGRTMLGLNRSDAHPDAGQLIERDDLDLIDVCTPQHLRRDIVVAACESGRHVLCEKPIAAIPRDAAAMVAAARSNGVRLAIVHNYLFFPEVMRALELIRAGEIGTVEVAILNWLGVVDAPGTAAYRPTWRHDPNQAGGGVLMDMLHIVYLAEALLGATIERVSAWLDVRTEGSAVEDIALCRFETERAAALVNIGWGIGPGGFSVSGSHGRIEVTYEDGGSGAFAPFERLVAHGRNGRREETNLPPEGSIGGVLSDLAVAIREGTDPIATGEQGQHILEATLAAYASAATGRTVPLPLQPGDAVYERGVAGLTDLEQPLWSPVRRRRIFGLA